MKFRTKLFYCFISLGIVSTLLALFIIYGEASRLIFNEVRSKILVLVVNSEKMINTDDLTSFVASNGNTHTEAYHNLRHQLLEVNDLAQKGDTYVQFAYIIRKYPNSKDYFFIVNAQGDDGESIAHYGDKYPSSLHFPDGKYVPFVTTHIYSNEWGTWLTGYAPIYNKQGEFLGFLGMDVRTAGIYAKLERLLLYGLTAFVISLVVAIIFAYFLARLVSSSLSSLCKTVEAIGEGEFSKRSSLHTRDEFSELSLAINRMAQGLEERERLKKGFTRYVSQYALEDLLKLDKPITLQGERKKVTTLFSDIRGFTSIAEKLPPEEVLTQLNEYFKEMINVVFSFGGTLDKFMGDGMMVEFGAPLEDDEQELHAVLAAINMHRALDKLTEKWEKEGKHRLEIGIGIHTGLAVVGNIGSEKRMEYTAIGDAVNVASRLERASKKTSKAIIVSQSVYEKTKDRFVFEDLHQIELPGREGYIQAYALDPHAQKNLE